MTDKKDMLPINFFFYLWTIKYTYNSEDIVMKFYLAFILPFLILPLMSCISFKLGDAEPQKAINIAFKEPSSPFALTKNSEADQAWQSKSTGNIIAIISKCSKNSDKPLNIAYQEIAKGFDRVDSDKQESIFFNGREALRGSFQGTIDGIAMSMETLQFNKNQCFYQLTYSGLSQNFKNELPHFEQFIKEFKAP